MNKKIGGLIFKTKRSNKVKNNHVFFKGKQRVKDYTLKLRLAKLRKVLILICLAILSISLIIGLLFLTFKLVSTLRNTTEKESTENVYGLEDIPIYPGSEFIFKDNLEDLTVKNFLSLGYTIYRLPKDGEIEKVFTFYSENLPSRGWSKTLSVPISSEEKRYGEYWTKQSHGLRIYSRLNDIWYQQITLKQAQTGLEDEVKKEVARKLLLLTSEKSDLLPDFPWRLSFPSEYSTKYYSSGISSFQGVTFQKIGSDNKVIIEPEGYNGATSFLSYIEKFLTTYNKKYSQRWKVLNSTEIDRNGERALKAIISNGKITGVANAIKNSQNTLVYVFVTFEDNDPFYDYIISKIQSATSL